MKKMVSITLTMLLLLTLVPLSATAATTVTTSTDLQTALNSDGEVALGADISRNTQLNVKGNCTLDLNGHELTITVTTNNGINIDSGKTLTIKDSQYTDDAPGTGKLTVTNKNTTQTSNYGAGINTTGATLIIESGTVEAIGGHYGAGIGGGYYSAGGGNITVNGGTTTINGGDITVTGGSYSAGIGGGSGGSGDTIIINGGDVTAIGGSFGAGVGGGSSGGSGGTITINGGNVTAIGSSSNSAGIGGSYGGNGGTITINDGDITAIGSIYGAGIGGASSGDGGTINISDGHVTAIGGLNGAGIGGGGGDTYGDRSGGNGGTLNISGGVIMSSGSGAGAGIGGGGTSSPNGSGGINTNLTISGGIVIAEGGLSGGLDVGSGYATNRGLYATNTGNLTVTGGTLHMASSGRGTNVAAPSFKDCIVQGDGAGKHEGTYNSDGKFTVQTTNITTDKPVGFGGESVTLTAFLSISRTRSISYPMPMGKVVFKHNGSEIGRSSIGNAGINGGYITALAKLNWTAVAGSGDITAEYLPGINDMYALGEPESGETVSIPLIIDGKTNPEVITWPSGLTAVTGQALSDISLDSFDNAGGTAGTFSWTYPTNSVGGIGKQKHSVTFTPDDTATYGTIKQDVTVTVSAASVIPKTLTAIAVTSLPAKTVYTEGDAFDPTGLAVMAFYSDNTFKILDGGDYSVSGYSSTPGTKTITVTYDGKSATFNVTVNAAVVAPPTRTLTAIAITSLPTKMVYNEGDGFDPAGMTVIAFYSDNSFTLLDGGDYSISGYTSTPGPKTITVTYDGKSATFNITVNPASYINGDVNNDTYVDLLDVFWLSTYISDHSTDINTYAADMNNDGIIDGVDAVILQLYINWLMG